MTVSSTDFSPELDQLSASKTPGVPLLNPVCSLDCSSCKTILNSNRRMTSPNPLALSYLGQILLRFVLAWHGMAGLQRYLIKTFIFHWEPGEKMSMKFLNFSKIQNISFMIVAD